MTLLEDESSRPPSPLYICNVTCRCALCVGVPERDLHLHAGPDAGDYGGLSGDMHIGGSRISGPVRDSLCLASSGTCRGLVSALPAAR